MPLLELKDLTVAYGRIEAVRGISLTVEEGELRLVFAWEPELKVLAV